MPSRRRRNETSGGVSPGVVDDDEARICDIRIGRPVSVARMRRVRRWRWPVKRRRFCEVSEAMFVAIRLSKGSDWGGLRVK